MKLRTLGTVGIAFVLGTAAAASAAAESAGALADLGRQIFFDTTLSASGRMACASCHDPRYAYGPAPGRAIALGGKDLDQPGTRAVPSLRYLRGAPPFALAHTFLDGDVAPVGGFTWDGRAASIREQARLPFLAANEMANGSPAEVVQKLRKAPYAGQFQALFGEAILDDAGRGFEAALMAIDSFQSTPAEFFPFSSRYDAFLRGEIELTEQEERGVALFKDPKKGNCASCHVATTRAGRPPLFTDYDYANVGVPRNPRIPANADPGYYDLGLCGPLREDLREQRRYCGFFRAPTLRNVAIRDAYFHNGAFGTLRDVLRFYVDRDLRPDEFYPRDAAGRVLKANDLPPGIPYNLDHDPPLDRTRGDAPALSDAEIEDLIAFLETLTDGDLHR
jgi:cytochrome c peroxidase